MDDPHKSLPHTSEIKNILPDVVHSQQIPTVGSVTNELESGVEASENTSEIPIIHDVEDSKTESISEHIPSKIEYSTDSDHADKSQDLLKVEPEQEKVSKNSSLNIPYPQSHGSDNPSTQEPSKVSLSLQLDVNVVSDIHLLSEESPVNLVLVSDLSKDTQEKSQNEMSNEKLESSEHGSPNFSHRSDKYLDSLNEDSSLKSDLSLQDSAENSNKTDSPEKVSSGSEEIIKLDIRGQGAPKFPFPAAKIIFGPPPEGGTLIDSNIEAIPVFPNLLSPFLVGAGDSVKVEEVFDDQEQSKEPSPEKSVQSSPEKGSLSSNISLPLSLDKQSLSSDKSLQMSPDKQSSSSDKVEADLLVEEITVADEMKEKDYDKPEENSMPKSMLPEETMSFSTLTTDYKTICEEYHVKLVHLEDAITQRDELIEELTISLQRSVREREDLRHENDHLTNEVQNLQHLVGERSHSEHDTIKAQLSDFMKYQSLIKDESTKFYSAVMSGGSSIQSSNGEKDMDREEIVINFSKSDLRSSDVSDEFQTGFENKLTTLINKFDSYIEENLRNKLRESLIQILCDEIGKMRLDTDTEIKELESQMQQDKQAFTVETRRLRELLESVKAGNADIDALRQELDVKHEKEMESLRTYFEKKCSDMERSYSEEVWRDKACASPGSATSLDAPDAAGDCARRRPRSAQPPHDAHDAHEPHDLPPKLSLESSQLEQALKHACKKYEQQIDELKAEHVAYVSELQATHREAIASLDEQITELKAHIQTAENTEANVSEYQQDIDLELEKKMEVQLEARLEEVRDEVRQEVVNHLQEQLQVLLSDPDAEVSSWPLELVALRDKIYGDAAKAQGEKECSSLRDELSVGEDKWKQRRNLSFDQNRQLEEVTRERDDLKRVAVSLHRVVGQLVAYCASAEDELNRTVLAQLLARLVPGEHDTIVEEESRPSTPNLSGDLNTSLVSRSGKHVHFAPDLNAILTDFDEEGIVNFLQHQRDLSADIKKELEHSLRRLRHEAHSLLDLSAKLAPRNRLDSNMLESSVQITELVDDLDSKQKSCDNCELHRKNMEEAMSECLQRENLLRSDLEAAMIKIAQFMTSGEVIAEGYGTGPGPCSPGPRARSEAPSGAAACSLDGGPSPRARRLADDLDSLQRERDDLHQQVRARSELAGAGAAACSLDGGPSPRARRLADDLDSLQRERDDLHQQVRARSELAGAGAAACSLDGGPSPRARRLADDLDSLQRERDDLHQQVRARSELAGAGAAACSLDGGPSPRARRLADDLDSLQRERDDLHQQVRARSELAGAGAAACSLDGGPSPRARRLADDLDSLQRERDDLHQQVRARSELAGAGAAACSLDGGPSPRARRLADDLDSLQRERDDLHQQVRARSELAGAGAAACSLDGGPSPRARRLADDLDSLQRERDDLHQQVRARSELAGAGAAACSLDGGPSPRARRLADDLDSLQRERDDLHQQVRARSELAGAGAAACSLDGGPSPRARRLADDLDSLQRERDDLHQQVRARSELAGAGAAACSLDGGPSPRARRLADDLDSLQRERDDLHQQLEAANRQLRSTRAFVEEQASEREAERDEFARRLHDLRDDNARLATRLQNNARILNEVEQLEAQTREMNQIITELETKKIATDDELKASEEKITLLRDIITNLESQLEQKTAHETEILEQLEQMKNKIEERDSRMRTLLGELESLRSERVEQSNVTCVKCGQEEEKTEDLLEKVKEQCRHIEEMIHRRTRKLERIHEVCSTSCSEPSEDVSLRDQRHRDLEAGSPEPGSALGSRMAQLGRVWECVAAHARAEDAVLKRVADLEMQRAQLKDVAQEVRAERDVLQARMSEQALRISSLSARLQQQRNDAEALSHQATSQLSVQLHDALAEVQRLKEELESKDKQLTRVKQNLEEREKLNEEHHSLYGNSCNPKDKVVILERELSATQSRIGQLESLARSLEKDKEELQAVLRDHQRALAEKEDQLQELLALKLDEVDQKENGDVLEGKASARTLSDIVSISEFDEQDLQMRRAELKGQNISLIGAPYADISKEKTFNRTLPPEFEKANMSSLNIEYVDHFELPGYTPRADSLPAHLTSTQNKDLPKQYKRNVNETTMFGIETKHGQIIQDNCSMYPNRDANDSKDVSVEPKKINFSLETTDNKTNNDFTSLGELGITVDVKQENFPDILTQLKHEIKKSRAELENCKSELKQAEEQLCEFPALKEEVEELKGLLENTMATMEHDKKFYENQLDNFSSNKKLLEQRLGELTQEVTDKSKDLHLLKEDLMRRENMILELAKEKRNLTNKMTELEVKIDELQSRNNALEKYEDENHQMRDKVNELEKLKQLVSEKNQQIDSLNQHLDRLDDLQRNLTDKTEELDNLKEAFEEKSNEVFHLQDTVEALNRDIAKINEENDNLNTHNKDLKLKLTKLEKEQENASLKLQSHESELERVNSLNSELTAKIDELKLLTDKLKDKETEIEILHEDINAFHEEIASLKEQLKMVSRSPSPRSKSGDERRSLDRQASNDKKQLVKIRKQVSLLQHELDFIKKELNDKAFELAKAKLDVTELRNNLSQANKQVLDKDADNAELKQQAESLQHEIQQLMDEKEHLAQQLDAVVARIREESNVSELKNKLRLKVERCQEMEVELENLREFVDRVRSSPARGGSESARALCVRSPTAELERAVRDQLHYSHTLDDDIMEQILSASSDEREEIPRLALNTSKSSSSIHSSSSDRINRLRSDNDKLLMQVNNLEARLKDKDALIAELNSVRDKLVQDWQTTKLRYEAERDNCGRLQLLLDTHKQTAESLQKQDSNMIQILKKRLEAGMQSELQLQQREQAARERLAQLQRHAHADPSAQLQHEMENSDRLKGEVSLLKSKLEVERTRFMDLQAMLDHSRLQAERELSANNEQCTALKNELAELKRLKHDAGVQLLRAKELIGTQNQTIAELERKLSAAANHKPVTDALTEIESTKTELARELATLKKCVLDTASPELMSLRMEKQQLAAKVERLEKEAAARTQPQSGPPDERDQAIRYLHGRCLRLESCRKALVWQKRYLQRVLAGYSELEKNLRLPLARTPEVSKGKKRFKCIATVVVIVLRMGFVVRRRQHVRALSAACILRTSRADLARNTPSGVACSSPAVSVGVGVGTPRSPSESLARRLLKHDMRLNLPASPALGDYVRRYTPYAANSPHDEPFILSSPRGEVAAAYLNKLELVSRCLNHAMDASRDVP